MKKFRFVGNGTYGGRSRAAAVPYIGDLFRGDEVFHDEEAKLLRFVRPNMAPVEATEQALSVLRGGDFNAELTCEHRFASGEGCAKKPIEGSPYCRFHERNKPSAAILSSKRVPVADPPASWQPGLPVEIMSDPSEVMRESIPSMPEPIVENPPAESIGGP